MSFEFVKRFPFVRRVVTTSNAVAGLRNAIEALAQAEQQEGERAAALARRAEALRIASEAASEQAALSVSESNRATRVKLKLVDLIG